uniref:Uncharacterized protein n=1 Tax=Anguilla anguilla TaxID=7936 RepID=A0A0E9S5U2_ANGAN
MGLAGHSAETCMHKIMVSSSGRFKFSKYVG